MSWLVTPSLLLGLALIAVPVVLHLVMRQKPKRVVFPALQFVKQRRETNRRRLQLRHLLLLLLRCLAIAVVLAALARPKVPSLLVGNVLLLALGGLAVLLLAVVTLAAAIEKKPLWMTGIFGTLTALLLMVVLFFTWKTLRAGAENPIGDQTSPVAAALVFDTSPRMMYRQDNRSRLAQAQKTGDWVLEQLPPGSKVAVIDSAAGEAVFSQDEAAAGEAIERLETTYVPRPLPHAIDAGLETALEEKDLRKEIYVFTDLNAEAWSGKAELLKRRLADRSDVTVYLIDVGVEKPRNFALGDVELPHGALLAKNGTLEIETTVEAVGGGADRTVELYIEQPDPTLPRLVDDKLQLPKPELRGQQAVRVEAGGSQAVRFRVAAPEPGVHQGYLRLTGGDDALEIDETRYFTVKVMSAWPVLVVAPSGVSPTNLVQAIAPKAYVESGEARYHCTVLNQNDLGNARLEDYRGVCLLDPQPLTPQQWNRLAAYVEQGGGLGVFLGHNARNIEAFNAPEPQQVLPGRLEREFRETYLSPRDLSHPVLAPFRPLASSVPWADFPVHLHWQIDRAPSAKTVLTYANGEPAILETDPGRGRVLTMTTPITDPSRPQGRAAWNELATRVDPWPYFVLVNEMMNYLVGSGEERLNYLVGETASLPNRQGADPDRYQLWPPQRDVQPLLADEGEIKVNTLNVPGAYRLKGVTVDGPMVRGFSANLPLEASDLHRIDRERLDEVLGEGRYKLARNRKQIDWSTREARQGWEFFPFLLLALALILGLEYVLANVFYRRREQT